MYGTSPNSWFLKPTYTLVAYHFVSLCMYIVNQAVWSISSLKKKKQREMHIPYGEMWLSYWHGKAFCVYTNLTGHFQYWDCRFPSALLQRTHLGQTALAALYLRDVWVRSQSSSFYPSPSTFYSWLSSFCFAQTGEVGLSKASSCVLGEQVKEQRWRQRDAPRELSTHFTCTVTARLESPSNLGQGRHQLLKIHKTIAEINIFLF